MKALVTGATGFIGGHLVETLRAHGHEVRALVRDESRAEHARASGAEILVGDVTDPASLVRAVEGMDVVFHAAALVGDWAPWPALEAVNVRGTENLLHAASKQTRRFVHVSSVAVYGAASHVLDESTPLLPEERANGVYARAKIAAERAVRRYQEEGRLATTILRPAWVVGPRDPYALTKPWRVWFGAHDPVRSLVHVADLADLAVLAARHPNAIGRAYNVSGFDVRLREYVTKICRALDMTPPRWTVPTPVITTLATGAEVAFRLARARRAPPLTRSALKFFIEDQRVDNTRAQRELGWTPQHDLAKTIASVTNSAR